MKITFEYPELLLTLAIVLYCLGHSTFCYVLFSLSLLSSFARFTMKVQKQTEENKRISEAGDQVKDAFYSMITAFNNNDDIQH